MSLLEVAAKIQEFGLDELKAYIAEDEYADRDNERYDPETRHMETQGYAEMMAMDATTLITWLVEYQADCATDRDWESIAYTQLLIDKAREVAEDA